MYKVHAVLHHKRGRSNRHVEVRKISDAIRQNVKTGLKYEGGLSPIECYGNVTNASIFTPLIWCVGYVYLSRGSCHGHVPQEVYLEEGLRNERSNLRESMVWFRTDLVN
ncbi:uncharacterized protein LAJ45_00753 [Morchella importuna]|uniref:uncharacterized protein n=1 Tax=Morchella importuna TaxID=1174673 RepID=UPI001E8E9191|nr:uncharacterized protein LAJ45_00753 [Morchella importuna]KAH8155743.1 hypothetical protein LAJ45_00753 [Morchella importuna]